VAVAAVAAVVVILSVMALLAANRAPTASHGSTGAARAATLAQQVPVSALDAVGAGKAAGVPKALPAGTPPLEQGGKPEILYLGAEYCPYCAAERWAIVVALSRFGTFSNLGGTESSATDAFPRTQTFTFHGSTYRSDVLSFVSVETNTNQPSPSGGYTSLEHPTAAEAALMQKYDQQPYTTQPGSIPFLMIGNRYVSVGATYDPTPLQGMTRDQIAAALSNPSDPIAQGVDGAANVLTAAICRLTGGQPSSVCADPVIKKIAAQLPTGA
jgi:hypothetical protein